MKTRVLKRFAIEHNRWFYWVQKFAEHDAADLREYGRRPNPPFPQFDWRFVRVYPTESEAIECAERIAAYGKDPKSARGLDGDDSLEIIGEFGADQ